MPPTAPKARRDRLVVRELPEEVLVYDLDRHRAYCLGSLAAAVWRRCDGATTSEELAAGLGAESGKALDVDLVAVALRRLGRARLLEGTPPAVATASPARRELLRRVAALSGLSVLSITVPTAAMAATCIPSGSQTCVDTSCRDAKGNKCCSGGCGQMGKTCGTGKGFTRVCN